MRFNRKLVLAAAFAVGCLFIQAEDAEAGRFWKVRRSQQQRAIQHYSYTNRTRSTTNRTWTQGNWPPKPPARNTWPGAIGAPSHRYQFFQNVNGYWY